MKERTKIYTIVETGMDVDHDVYPDPEALCSFLSLKHAEEELARLVSERKKNLRPRLDQEDAGAHFWEASEQDYEICNYMRLEILTTELMDGGVQV